MTEPAESQEPIEKIDSAEPTLPIEANEPTLPTDSTDPFEPIDSRLSCDHSDQREPELFMPAAWQRAAGVSMPAVRSVIIHNAGLVAHGQHGAGCRGGARRPLAATGFPLSNRCFIPLIWTQPGVFLPGFAAPITTLGDALRTPRHALFT